MTNKFLPLAAVIVLSLGCAVSDFLIKQASGNAQPIWCRQFWYAVILYLSTLFGWVYVLRHMKLSIAGVVYSFCTAGALIGIGVFFFKETLGWREIVGIAFGLLSIVLLGSAI